MRAGKGPGPAPRPQPDNSHPNSPAALPEPRRLTPWLPRSRGAADAGPHAAMPGDATRRPPPEVTVQAERLQHSVWNRSPGRARPLPPGGRARPVVGTRNRRTCRPGRTLHPRPASTAGLPARLQTPTSAVGCTGQACLLTAQSVLWGTGFFPERSSVKFSSNRGSSQVSVLERALWFLGGIVENRLLQRPDER